MNLVYDLQIKRRTLGSIQYEFLLNNHFFELEIYLRVTKNDIALEGFHRKRKKLNVTIS